MSCSSFVQNASLMTTACPSASMAYEEKKKLQKTRKKEALTVFENHLNCLIISIRNKIITENDKMSHWDNILSKPWKLDTF